MATVPDDGPGDLALSQTRLARQLGVSKATVSRVLNNSPNVRPETRQKVLKALNESRLAMRQVSAGKPRVGLIIRNRLDAFHGAFIQRLMSSLMEGAMTNEMLLQPVDVRARKMPDESYAQLIMRLGFDGVVHLEGYYEVYHVMEEMAEAGIPQFLITGRVDNPVIGWIDVENVESSCSAVEYLINQGHRRIAVVTASMATQAHTERFAGYRKALEKSGIEFDPSLHLERRDVNIRAGVSIILPLLARPDRPTAIFFTNEELAIGGVKACHQAKVSIPDEISLLAFADSDLPEMVTPSLTYLRQPIHEMGLMAMAFMCEQLKHNSSAVHQEVIRPGFFVNESTGLAPKAP